ncbi:hypothetical protein AB0L13_28880 [Saccharopolyspora shandongensis]|uniref:hypothetical protein n=1 Tax=Saccharopolyspora shandongensis TaxID=418495 RepID=UPI003447E3F5
MRFAPIDSPAAPWPVATADAGLQQQTNGIVQVWAYDDLDQRAHALDEAAARGLCPPADGPAPLEQVSKLMTPSAFSPLQ